METSTIQIEAFNNNLHGCRILVQGPFATKKYPPMLEYVQKLREPFKKRILITNMAVALSKYMPMQVDASFQAKDTADWTLILTYMTYAPKPLLVIAEDIQIPDGVWQKLNRTMTFVHVTSNPVAQLRPYEAIFFAPMEELGTAYGEHVYKALQSVYKPTYSQKEHKEILQELRIAGAGIAWSKEEQDPKGAMYWYDPIQHQGDRLSDKQLSELFGYLSDQFQS